MKFLDSMRYNCVPINRLEYTKENIDNKISYRVFFVFCFLFASSCLFLFRGILVENLHLNKIFNKIPSVPCNALHGSCT